MPERRRFTQTTSLKTAFAKEATQLRKQRKVPPLGVERGLLVRKACRAETSFPYDRVAGIGPQAPG